MKNQLQARCILLDIEGTLSDIRFVYDVMFPYAQRELKGFLSSHWNTSQVQEAIRIVAKDAEIPEVAKWLGEEWKASPSQSLPIVLQHLQQLMAHDIKATGLKQLQGLVWQTGFESGALSAELFDDVLPALKRWKDDGLDIRIFSSGSILAQKMFFQHTLLGDLTSFFSAHFDTTIGSKKDALSYQKIANQSQLDPSAIVFVTDVYAELLAARQAGMQIVASIRPGNVPLPTEFTDLAITDFSQLHIVVAK